MFLQLFSRFIGLHNAGGKRCGKCAKPCVEKGTAGCAPIIFCVNQLIFLPSLDKGRHGFGGQNCSAPASDVFSSDFWFLSRRRAESAYSRRCCRATFLWSEADARQGEKGKKRRKDTLAGVFSLVKRWYIFVRPCKTGERRHLQRPGKYDKIGIVPCGTDDYTARRRAGGMIWQERAHTTTRAYPA